MTSQSSVEMKRSQSEIIQLSKWEPAVKFSDSQGTEDEGTDNRDGVSGDGDFLLDPASTRKFTPAPMGDMRGRVRSPTMRRKSSSGFQFKSNLDHNPHELFVEMDELITDGPDGYLWQEKCRWIKFEEDIEEGPDRWGKPHIPMLTFSSLLQLRSTIEDGFLLLDVEEDDMISIMTHVVTEWIREEILTETEKDDLLEILLADHRHVGEQGLPFLHRHDHHIDTVMPQESEKERLDEEKGLTEDCKEYKPLSKKQSISNQQNGAFNKYLSEDERKQSAVRKGSMAAFRRMSVAVGKRRGSVFMKKITPGAEATAIMVGRLDTLKQPCMAFVRLAEGSLLGSTMEMSVPVRFLYILVGPDDFSLDYHEIGRSMGTLMNNKRFHYAAYKAIDHDDLLSAVSRYLDDTMVMMPDFWQKETLLPIMQQASRRKSMMVETEDLHDLEEEKLLAMEEKEYALDEIKEPDDPLKRTGRLFGGLIRDVRRRYPLYWSDIKDGLNTQCLAAFVFIYFAALAPAITFGGLLSEITDKWMGVSEMLVMSAVCGLLFGLLAGQPILIVGATGPLLVFEAGLYQFCSTIGLEFLPFRVWVSIWLAIITVIVVMLEGSFLVRYFTRFTQEIFASLISLIFIFEVFKKLYLIFRRHPLWDVYSGVPWWAADLDSQNTTEVSGNDTNSTDPTKMPIPAQPNTALLSLILTTGTFILAYSFKEFRNGTHLGRTARRALGDFGIPLSILIMVVIDFLIQETFTEKLDVPDGLAPTASYKRGWFIHPLGYEKVLPIWATFAASIPAILVFILIFMETEITSMIVNKKDRKLKKGSGFHLDLLLLGFFAIIGGFLGLPLVCCATVRSVSHVSALSVYGNTHAPGEKPKLIEVKEQRVTCIAVHIMIGVSVLMGPVLRRVPLAVLFGVFLYMGVASMSGIQLFERVELMFKPVKHHPQKGFVRRVKTWKMHLFTGIQLVCLAVLWVVKSTIVALGFPFFLILTVPLRRYGLRVFFTEHELAELDRDEEVEYVDEDEEDFYTEAKMTD